MYILRLHHGGVLINHSLSCKLLFEVVNRCCIGPSASSPNASEERGDVEDANVTYTPHEKISLCLQHCDRCVTAMGHYKYTDHAL